VRRTKRSPKNSKWIEVPLPSGPNAGAPSKRRPDKPDVGTDPVSLYQLVGLPVASAHVLRLEVAGGLRLFAFTFG
jgi:hypothetical protein